MGLVAEVMECLDGGFDVVYLLVFWSLSVRRRVAIIQPDKGRGGLLVFRSRVVREADVGALNLLSQFR